MIKDLQIRFCRYIGKYEALWAAEDQWPRHSKRSGKVEIAQQKYYENEEMVIKLWQR